LSPSPAPDVVIVGAGPVGLVAAAELARRGVRVRIIDKLAVPTSESRAIAVHARSLDMLHRMGVVDQLAATGLKAVAMQLYTGGDRLFRVPLGTVDSAFPYTVVTAQTETERVLTEHAESLGVTVERGLALVGLTQDDRAVHLNLRQADGTTEDVTASWVIGADGAHSAVRHLVGTKLQGSFQGERFLLADIDATHSLDTDSMHTFFSPDGPIAVFPMINDRLRVIAQTRGAADEPLNLNPTRAEVQAVLDQRIGGVAIQDSHWLTSFEVHHAQVPSYRWDRVFLAGDAAHIHSPAGGQGMNTGMQDAFNLAWKLAAVVHGDGGQTLLDTYHTERHPVAAAVITFSDRLTKLGTLSGAAQHLRDLALRMLGHVGPFTRQLASVAEEIDINYKDSPIAVGPSPRDSKVAAGEHLPHVADTALQTRLGEVCQFGHAVLTVAGNQVAPAAGGPGPVQVLVSDTDNPMAGYDAVVADPSGQLATRLGLKNGGRVVVRPDGYLGAITTLDHPAPVTDYFARLAR
jgi:2-polyprenyl-6-methoxyphenol hydroxylase-like FAD-dependent oxidoreductase